MEKCKILENLKLNEKFKDWSNEVFNEFLQKSDKILPPSFY